MFERNEKYDTEGNALLEYIIDHNIMNEQPDLYLLVHLHRYF